MRTPAGILVVVMACGTSHDAATPDGPGPDVTPVDAAPPPTMLAASGMQLLVTGPQIGLQVTPANLADDVDVIELHHEFYGVPWDAFAADTAPPAAWVAQMDQIASSTGGKPVFLSVSMLNGGRNTLAPKALAAGGTQEGWAATCYDFATASDAATYQQAYVRYVSWMIDEYKPTWLNIAIEENLFFEACPVATPGLIAMTNAAYDAAKAKQPDLIVFPSIEIDHLYGYTSACATPADPDACFDTNYAQLATLKRDRFAMSTYPVEIGNQPIDQLPADWFTRGAARGGERPLVAETGNNNTALVAEARDGSCPTIFSATEADEAAYLTRLLADAKAAHMELVNWWSDRDLVTPQLMTNCPCTFDATWCGALDAFRGPSTTSGTDTQLIGEITLKAFGTMGLRTYDGTPKALYATWQAARATP